MAQEILVHDNFIGSDLTPLPPDLSGNLQTIEIVQETVIKSAVDYLKAVMADQVDVLSVFPADFHIDPRNVLATILPYLPFQKERPAEAQAFAEYVDTVVKATPANLGAPQVRLRLLISNASLRPSSLMSPGVATSVATVDTGERMMRSCLVPPVSDIPSLDELIVPAGALIICQQLPFLNQQTDLRKWGWDSPAGLYTERERALTVTKNVDGPEPESLTANSPYSLSTAASATLLAGLSNGMGTASKVMSGENINPAEIAGIAAARGREMAAEFVESAEASNPGTESPAEAGARQYAAGALPMKPPQDWSQAKAAAALAAGGVAAYEGFEKKRQAQEKELQLTNRQKKEAQRNTKLSQQSLYEDQRPAPRPVRQIDKKELEAEISEGSTARTVAAEKVASQTKTEASEVEIRNLATQTAAAEAEITASGAPEPSTLEPARPSSALVQTGLAIQPTDEPAASESFNQPGNFATAEMPDVMTTAALKTTAAVTENGIGAAVPSLPIEIPRKDEVSSLEPGAPAQAAAVIASAGKPVAAAGFNQPEDFATAGTESGAGTAETFTDAPVVSSSVQAPLPNLPIESLRTTEAESFEPAQQKIDGSLSETPRSELATVTQSETVAAPQATNSGQASEAPSLSRQEVPKVPTLEDLENLTVSENNLLPTSEGIRRDAKATASEDSSALELNEERFKAGQPTVEASAEPVAQAERAKPAPEPASPYTNEMVAETRAETLRDGPTRYDDLRAETPQTHEPSIEPKPPAERDLFTSAADKQQPENSPSHSNSNFEDRREARAQTTPDDTRTSSLDQQPKPLQQEQPSMNGSDGREESPPNAAARYEDLRAETSGTEAPSIDMHHQNTRDRDPNLENFGNRQGPKASTMEPEQTAPSDTQTSHASGDGNRPEATETADSHNLGGQNGSDGTGPVYADNLNKEPQPAQGNGSSSKQSVPESAEQNYAMHHHFQHGLGDTAQGQNDIEDNNSYMHQAAYMPDSLNSSGFGYPFHNVNGIKTNDLHIMAGESTSDPNDFSHLTGAGSLWGKNGQHLHEAGGAAPFLASWLGIGVGNQSDSSQPNQGTSQPSNNQRDRFGSSYKTRSTHAGTTDAMVMKVKLAEAKLDIKNGEGPHILKNGAEQKMAEEEDKILQPQPPLPSPEPE